jgi:hypothetical protein
MYETNDFNGPGDKYDQYHKELIEDTAHPQRRT